MKVSKYIYYLKGQRERKKERELDSKYKRPQGLLGTGRKGKGVWR